MQSNAYVPRKLHRTRPTTKLRTQQHRMDKLRKATMDHQLQRRMHRKLTYSIDRNSYPQNNTLLETNFTIRSLRPDGLGIMQQDLLNFLKKLHSRAGRIIYRLPWDISSENVLERAGWVPLSAMYKNRLAQFVYRVVNGLLPQEMLRLFRTKATRYNLKNRHALIYTSKTRDKLFEKLNSLSRSHLVEQLTSEHKISWWQRQF